MANTKDLIGEQETLDGLVNQTLTELEDDGIDKLGGYAFAQNKALTSVNFPNVTDIGNAVFMGCENLIFANLPSVKEIRTQSFDDCTKLTTPIFNVAATSIMDYAFRNCKALTGLEVPATVPMIRSFCFSGCSSLTWLRLLKTSMVSLSDTNALNATPIAAGIGAIYVPSNLVATYKADSKWGQFIIASIDDYPITDYSTISDSWSDILAAEANGTYSTKYAIGDTKKAVINGDDVYMQIVAFDADTLTGGGTAKITWVAKMCFGAYKMNNIRVTNENGWAASDMRTWLRDTVYIGLDSGLRTAIKEVDKTYYDKTSNTTKTVSDTLWIPSWREVGLSTSNLSCESSGPIYSGIFTNTNSTRIKYNNTTLDASNWWLRSASQNTSNFMNVVYHGSGSDAFSTSQYGVVFGFCT